MLMQESLGLFDLQEDLVDPREGPDGKLLIRPTGGHGNFIFLATSSTDSLVLEDSRFEISETNFTMYKAQVVVAINNRHDTDNRLDPRVNSSQN